LIQVTKLNNAKIIVNADLIEFVEATPDTLITLTTGRKVMVRESLRELLEAVLAYRARTRSYPVPVAPSQAPPAGGTGGHRQR
jgi:flagellar protein FlbD